jgi:hypothetical protein
MPSETFFNGRRAVFIENEHLHLTVLHGGGHIAAVHDKATGVNPLWVPPWASIDTSRFDAARHRDYGDGVDAPLLAGIAGHNLCLDIFGGPSDEEARAGLPVHGEASNVDYDLSGGGGSRVWSSSVSSSSAAAPFGSAKRCATRVRSTSRLAGRSTSPSARRFWRRGRPSSARR